MCIQVAAQPPEYKQNCYVSLDRYFRKVSAALKRKQVEKKKIKMCVKVSQQQAAKTNNKKAKRQHMFCGIVAAVAAAAAVAATAVAVSCCMTGH